VVGREVVGLMPYIDAPNQITEMNAMAVTFEIVCLIADRIRGR
jgi:guanidinopropionase